MAQRSARPDRARVRSASIFILAVCVLLIVAILAAWRGSVQMYGRIPEVRFSTNTWSLSAEPVYYDTPEHHGGDGTQYIRPLSDRQTVTVMLPGELQRAPLAIFATRIPDRGEPSTDIRAYAPGEAKTLEFPAVTDAGYLAEVVVYSGTVPVYDADGNDSVLAGEWSLQVRPVAKEGTARLQGLPPAETFPDSQKIEIPDNDAAAGGGAPSGEPRVGTRAGVPDPHRAPDPHAVPDPRTPTPGSASRSTASLSATTTAPPR